MDQPGTRRVVLLDDDQDFRAALAANLKTTGTRWINSHARAMCRYRPWRGR